MEIGMGEEKSWLPVYVMVMPGHNQGGTLNVYSDSRLKLLACV